MILFSTLYKDPRDLIAIVFSKSLIDIILKLSIITDFALDRIEIDKKAK